MVGAVVPQEHVGSVAPVDLVPTHVPDQDVVVGRPLEVLHVHDRVEALPGGAVRRETCPDAAAREEVPDPVVSSAAVQHVGSPLPDQTITSRATADRIVAGASVRKILASAGGDRVGVRVAIDPVRSGTTSDRVGAVAAADPVVPPAAEHGVVATQREDDVVPRRAVKDVGAVRARDRGLAREAQPPLRLREITGGRDQDESRHDERHASQHGVGAYVATRLTRRGGCPAKVTRSADHLVQTPTAGDALQLVLTGVVELQTRTRDEVLHRL